MRVLPAVAAASLVLGALSAAPAWAAPPDNDTYAGRLEVTEPLPWSASQSTLEATTDADDASFAEGCSGIPALDATVWYEYTPSSEGGVVVDLSGSDYSAGMVVATGAPGSWVVEACGPMAVAWYALPGTTYTVLVFDDQTDESGTGGALELRVAEVPPPPTLDITVNPTATFNAKTGTARVSGTYSCQPGDNVSSFVFLDVQLSQRVGRLFIRGYGGTELVCDGAEGSWSVDIVGENGLFKGGRAASVTIGYACGDFECSEDYEERTVQLKGVKR